MASNKIANRISPNYIKRSDNNSSPSTSLSPHRRSPRRVEMTMMDDDHTMGKDRRNKSGGDDNNLPVFLRRRIQFRERSQGLATREERQNMKDRYLNLNYKYDTNKLDRKLPVNLQLKWPAIAPPGPGLTNEGNTCFLNATLQCLLYCVPFASYLKSNIHNQRCPLQAQACLLCELKRLYDRMTATTSPNNAGMVTRRTSVAPVGMVSRLREVAKHFRLGRQEDAHEYLRFLLDSLSDRFLAVDRMDLVNAIFGGCLQSQINCQHCGHSSVTMDPILDVSLDLPPGARSLEQAWQHFTAPERLRHYSYKCSQCGTPGAATKQLGLCSPPPVLTLHLKRFSNQATKISRFLAYPERLSLDVHHYQAKEKNGRQVKYDLFAVLVHQGHTCTGGHYYAFVKAANSLWYEMNDTNVKQVSLKTVLDQPAYLLFYLCSLDFDSGSDVKVGIDSNVQAAKSLASKSHQKELLPTTQTKYDHIKEPMASPKRRSHLEDVTTQFGPSIKTDTRDKRVKKKLNGNSPMTTINVGGTTWNVQSLLSKNRKKDK